MMGNPISRDMTGSGERLRCRGQKAELGDFVDYDGLKLVSPTANQPRKARQLKERLLVWKLI